MTLTLTHHTNHRGALTEAVLSHFQSDKVSKIVAKDLIGFVISFGNNWLSDRGERARGDRDVRGRDSKESENENGSESESENESEWECE